MIRNFRSGYGNRLLCLLLLLFTIGSKSFAVQSSTAALWEAAAQAYAVQDYAGAIRAYDSLRIAGWESAALYYNLGTCYFRQEDLANSMLFLERGRRLAPRDQDILQQLAVVRKQLPDQIADPTVNGWLFYTRYPGMLWSSQWWGIVTLVALWLAMTGLALWQLAAQVRQRRWGFFSGIFFLVVTVLFGWAAARSAEQQLTQDIAIVMEAEVPLRVGADSRSPEQRMLHAGTTVFIEDKIGDWLQVSLGNGEEGWLPENALTRI
ncbi:MAG: hypothetical protein H6555_07630 [Lewinellaceae bacterium]|nr:hypothetical protein [Lewinellaceae bacterium]